jgi:predicted RNase H-like HicB family nuclease
MEGRERHYSILIEWEPQDQIYIARVPELPHCITHGATYEEALAQIQDALDGYIDTAEKCKMDIPAPHTYELDKVPAEVLAE